LDLQNPAFAVRTPLASIVPGLADVNDATVPEGTSVTLMEGAHYATRKLKTCNLKVFETSQSSKNIDRIHGRVIKSIIDAKISPHFVRYLAGGIVDDLAISKNLSNPRYRLTFAGDEPRSWAFLQPRNFLQGTVPLWANMYQLLSACLAMQMAKVIHGSLVPSSCLVADYKQERSLAYTYKPREGSETTHVFTSTSSAMIGGFEDAKLGRDTFIAKYDMANLLGSILLDLSDNKLKDDIRQSFMVNPTDETCLEFIGKHGKPTEEGFDQNNFHDIEKVMATVHQKLLNANNTKANPTYTYCVDAESFYEQTGEIKVNLFPQLLENQRNLYSTLGKVAKTYVSRRQNETTVKRKTHARSSKNVHISRHCEGVLVGHSFAYSKR